MRLTPGNLFKLDEKEIPYIFMGEVIHALRISPEYIGEYTKKGVATHKISHERIALWEHTGGAVVGVTEGITRVTTNELLMVYQESGALTIEACPKSVFETFKIEVIG